MRLITRVAQVAGLCLSAIVILTIVGTIWWRLAPTHRVDVLVYDQTVANDRYPDHAVLDQIFEYHRVPFELGEDYVGSAPGGNAPHGEWPTDRPELIILADLYGLYADDEGELDEFGDQRITDRLTQSQAEDVQRWVDDGTPAYGEFGLVTEPTAATTGLVFEETFGFQQTQWALKPYDDLQQVSPRIQSLDRDGWPHEGPGWIIVSVEGGGRDVDQQVIVVPDAQLLSPLPIVEGGPPGSGGGSAPFGGWIGIVEAHEDSVVDARFRLDVAPQAAQILASVGVPLEFPALVRTDRTLYFAGDGLDDETPFRLRRLAGGASITRAVTGSEFRFLYQVLEPSIGWLLDRTPDLAQ